MRNRHHFTLIELLMVISVIVILMSLLLPALSKAKEKSRQIACLSNLKQVGLFTNLYLQDNDSLFPVDYIPGPPYESSFCFQLLLIYSGNFVDKYRVAVCSMFDKEDFEIKTSKSVEKFNNYYIFAIAGFPLYGYNHRTLGCAGNKVTGFGCIPGGRILRSSQVRNPSALIESSDFSFIFLYPPTWINFFTEGAIYTHGRNINLLFTDGHSIGASRTSEYFSGTTYFNN